jgi:hypothetical protein
MVSFFAVYHLLIQNTHCSVSFIPRMQLGVACVTKVYFTASSLSALYSHPFCRTVFPISAFLKKDVSKILAVQKMLNLI